MTLWKNSAPAYAVPYMEQGTFVRTFNDNICYLYKKTSQRVPGKKYPVPYEKWEKSHQIRDLSHVPAGILN